MTDKVFGKPQWITVKSLMANSKWRKMGSYEVLGSTTTWECEIAVKSEGVGLWLHRWRGEEVKEEILGPSSIESLTDELVEMFNADRDELMSLYSLSGVRDFEDFADEADVINRPMIEHHLANGKKKATWLTRIGPNPLFHIHHARTQPRDPKTGAFHCHPPAPRNWSPERHLGHA
jgi:hypothetical protein